MQLLPKCATVRSAGQPSPAASQPSCIHARVVGAQSQHRKPRIHAIQQDAVTISSKSATQARNCKDTYSYKVLQRVTEACRNTPLPHSEPGNQAATLNLLQSIYSELENTFYSKGGYVIPDKERRTIDSTGGSSSYGEILPEGVDQLVLLLALDESSILCDLGSGLGRAVLQVALTTPVKLAMGLELSSSRVDQANEALAMLQRHDVQHPPVQFIEADLSTCNLDQATHFYLCSTAFGAALCRSIAERLSASPNFQALVTSRQLPTQPYLLKIGEFNCQYSWTATGTGYVYAKSWHEAPTQLLSNFCSQDGMAWLPSSTRPLIQGISVEQPVLSTSAQNRFVPIISIV